MGPNTLHIKTIIRTKMNTTCEPWFTETVERNTENIYDLTLKKQFLLMYKLRLVDILWKCFKTGKYIKANIQSIYLVCHFLSVLCDFHCFHVHNVLIMELLVNNVKILRNFLHIQYYGNRRLIKAMFVTKNKEITQYFKNHCSLGK